MSQLCEFFAIDTSKHARLDLISPVGSESGVQCRISRRTLARSARCSIVFMRRNRMCSICRAFCLLGTLSNASPRKKKARRSGCTTKRRSGERRGSRKWPKACGASRSRWTCRLSTAKKSKRIASLSCLNMQIASFHFFLAANHPILHGLRFYFLFSFLFFLVPQFETRIAA